MPNNPILTESSRDVVAMGSAVITVVSWVIAIWQIRKTKSAAIAAEQAAERAAENFRLDYRRYVLANAVRSLTELKLSVESRRWERALVRLQDLAEQVSQFAEGDEPWHSLSQELREWENDLLKLDADRESRVWKKWEKFLLRLHGPIDQAYGPFNAQNREVRG